MSASITSRARIARRKAHRLELRLSQRGGTYRLTDDHGVTHELGPLAVIETYLAGHYTPRPPGPQPTVKPPPGWGVILEDYLLTLAAAGQRDATLRLRRYLLIRMAYGLGQPPESVTGELLVAWFGSQAHWALETRRSHRAAARCFFTWAYRTGKVPTYLADELPKVRQPKAPPRPAPDAAWAAALAAADPRITLMLRLAAEAGLRRAEVARVHHRDLSAGAHGFSLLVHGKGGKQRVVPISDSLAKLLRAGAAGHSPGMPERGWLFPTGFGGHLTPDAVGRLVARALPDDFAMHTLRHRFATRAYRGTHNLRAVQVLLGHTSIATTERYLAVDDSEVRAAMVAAG
jgi:integrase